MEESVLVHELRKVISLVSMLRDIGLDKHLTTEDSCAWESVIRKACL